MWLGPVDPIDSVISRSDCVIRLCLSDNHKHSMHSCERSQLLAFQGDNESREIRRAEFLI